MAKLGNASRLRRGRVRNSISIMSARIFSKEDDEVLKNLYPIKTNKELVEVFNGQFSAQQIKDRAKALKLFKTEETKTRARVAKGWELWEMELLRRHYSKEGSAKCQEYLPHRSLKAIGYKARRMGLRLSEEARKASHANGPKHHTEATKQKISKVHKGKKWSEERRNRTFFKVGSDNHNFIDGRSYKKQSYSSGWGRIREEIKARDKNCRLCGKKNLLVVHHIDGNKKNSVQNNLITLCRKCHAKVHKNLDKYTEKLHRLIGTQETCA